MNDPLLAFGDASFAWVRALDSVWTDALFDVDDLNRHVLDTGIADFLRQTRDPKSHPVGQVIIGTAGSGKTHLVGRFRQRVWESAGWFVLLDIVGLKDFWTSAALCFANAMQQPMPDGRSQGEAVLAAIARTLKVEQHLRVALDDPAVSLKVIALLVSGLSRVDRAHTLQHQDVFRALYLLCSSDFEASNLAYAWLQGMEVDAAKARELGFGTAQKAPVDLVRGLSWIMSLGGPTLVAIDQIDGLGNPSGLLDGGEEEPPLIEILAAGLMELHDVRLRGMTVVTCLEATWDNLKTRALHASAQRFATVKRLLAVADGEAVGRLIAKRLAPAYAEAGFTPLYATWPFTPEAVESAANLLPRQILMRCDDHRRLCIDKGEVTLCATLDGRPQAIVRTGLGQDADLEGDAAFEQACRNAEIAELLNETNDTGMGALLREMLTLYIAHFEPAAAIDLENRSDPAQRKPPLHGRLTFIFHDQGDREEHFCFRAVEHSHWNAFQSRLGAAITAAGIDPALPHRRLFLVRRAALPTTPKMAELVRKFIQAGGRVINPKDDDLKSFVALRNLRNDAASAGKLNTFEAWVRARKPLCATDFFQQSGLCSAPGVLEAPIAAATEIAEVALVQAGPVLPERATDLPYAKPQPAPRQPAEPVGELPFTPPTIIPVGHRMAVGGEPVSLPLMLLPRHTAIIAGSGSGKTVLLRRLIEEAALAGIPAIVIDPNNDLSRLGDPWPERPASFTPEDDAKARRYRDAVDVVVWTPGVRAGNPLFLSVLPDFSGLGENSDELDQAIEMAAETFGPIAGAKSALQKGVLFDAIRYFAKQGGGDLRAMTALLTELADGISPITNAAKLAAGMADQLHAAVATNPLLKIGGPVLDPRLLFYGPDPQRTRVSVINLSGLASDTAREDFVNRLQMTLFGWIKRHPSPTGRLYAIDEAQNFVPSGQSALSRGSAVRLVAQARKYGLGMILATQAPKGIDNKVVSNCTTQFFGKQNSPTDINSVREIIIQKSGRGDDIAKLNRGEFYFATEGSGRPAKIRTPICLSNHPANPPTPEDVVIRAKRALAG